MKHASKISILNTAAALSLLLSASSCAKVSIDNPGQAERYIGFTSAVETKAPVGSSDEMDGFAVWAAHYTDGSLNYPLLPMDGIDVYKDNSGAWVYDDLKLWEYGYWHFEAFYPLPSDLQAIKPVQGKDALEVIFTAPKGEGAVLEGLTVNYYYGPTASHDLMTAEYTRTYTATDPDASAVNLTFNHLLSRVTISVKTSGSNISLTDLTFSGMSVLGEYNGVENSGKWRLLTDYPVFSDFPAGEFHADLTDWQNPLPSDGPPIDVLRDLLLIPQTPGDDANGLDPIEITATYSVGGAAPEEKTLTLPADPSWEPGRHYRYTLTLGTTDVTLNIDVVDWEDTEDNNITW